MQKFRVIINQVHQKLSIRQYFMNYNIIQIIYKKYCVIYQAKLETIKNEQKKFRSRNNIVKEVELA